MRRRSRMGGPLWGIFGRSRRSKSKQEPKEPAKDIEGNRTSDQARSIVYATVAPKVDPKEEKDKQQKKQEVQSEAAPPVRPLVDDQQRHKRNPCQQRKPSPIRREGQADQNCRGEYRANLDDKILHILQKSNFRAGIFTRDDRRNSVTTREVKTQNDENSTEAGQSIEGCCERARSAEMRQAAV